MYFYGRAQYAEAKQSYERALRIDEAAFSEILAGINALPPQDQDQLRRLLEEPASVPQPAHQVAPPAPVRDIARESDWIQQHRDKYAGQWVALDGDRLISSGPSAKEVYAAAKAAGVMDALIVKIESRDRLPFAGF